MLLAELVLHLHQRTEALELQVSTQQVTSGGLYRGALRCANYGGQSVRLTLMDIKWTGAAGTLLADGSDGCQYEAYCASLNHWPNDAAWQRVNRQPWRV